MSSTPILRKWRRTLWRWHRRVGISALAFLAVMAATGIVLNHADGWRLYDTRLPYRFAIWAYGDVGARQVVGLAVQDKQLYQKGSDLIFNESLLATDCEGRLNGMVVIDKFYWISCDSTLLAVTESGDFVESITLEIDPPTAIANCSNNLCLLVGSEWRQFDFLTLDVTTTDAQPSAIYPENIEFESLPEYLQITPKELNVGRLVADLHSGALFKTPGKLAVDLLGFIVLFLSVSGCYLWLGNRRK